MKYLSGAVLLATALTCVQPLTAAEPMDPSTQQQSCEVQSCDPVAPIGYASSDGAAIGLSVAVIGAAAAAIAIGVSSNDHGDGHHHHHHHHHHNHQHAHHGPHHRLR